MAEEEEIAADRHVAGEIPPVKEESAVNPADQEAKASASELAFDNPEAVTHDVKAIVTLFAINNFEGDLKKAFDAYDKDQDGGLTQDELASLLGDAGVAGANKIATHLIGEGALADDSYATYESGAFERTFA